MISIMRAKTNHNPPQLLGGVDPDQLWYVSDRRIRTKTAAEDARQIAEWIELRREPEQEPNEQQLFAAMHTAAFRAARKSTTRQIPRKERAEWARRWQILRSYLVEK